MGGGEQRGTCYWPLNGPLKAYLSSFYFNEAPGGIFVLVMTTGLSSLSHLVLSL